MALMEVNFYSNTLGMNSQVNVILPQKRSRKRKYPVLYLLHTAGGDHSMWCRRTSIERYVEGMGMAVVMPSVHLSMYTNMIYGGAYFDYVADELPLLMQQMFPISAKREENSIAGASMGGYGAVKIGLSRPEQYSAIGCFSSGNIWKKPLSRNAQSAFGRNDDSRNMAVFGTVDRDELTGSEHDLLTLAAECVFQNKPLPRIYQVCGTDDFLLDVSREMNNWFQDNGKFDYQYQEMRGGHTWDFWDLWVQNFLRWIV